MKISNNALFPTLLGLSLFFSTGSEAQVYFASGIKVGEVSDSTAIVWARLTKHEQPIAASAPMFQVVRQRSESKPDEPHKFDIVFPDGTDVESVRFAAPGTSGQLKIACRKRGTSAGESTSWLPASADKDFVVQHKLTGLDPNSVYELELVARPDESSPVSGRISGEFKTSPAADAIADVNFVVSTGQGFDDRDGDHGFDIYPQMLRLNPEFFVHTGDIVYYDRLAKNPQLARYHWQRTYSRPTNIEFHRQVASYFIKDDHDTLVNDCWPTMKVKRMGELTFSEGQRIFREQVPMGELTYRTRRWGRDLQIWLVEGRDFRSSNRMPDGPEKTIWGERQKAWFKSTVNQSDATFRVLISPTPLVGPDRLNKADNHSNRSFAHEGNELREFISTQKNMFVVCGDRHWQYYSIDPKSGVREYSCGPASQKHAGGWRQADFREDYHKYLNVGGGFLEVRVQRTSAGPAIAFRFFDTKGKVRFEDRQLAK